ncbi:MAG: hypothetical protein H8E84_03965 [Flavobacteriales bacterium]|nr:hypothetical protein [Flavobacteriales bacterium]
MFLRLSLLIVGLCLSIQSNAQNLISHNLIHHYTENELEGMWKENKISQWIVPINNGIKMYEINTFLPEIPANVVHPDLLEEYKNNPDFKFNNALKENDLLDWKPESPTQLCYCNADIIVLYENALVAHKKMKENGSKTVKLRKVGKKFNHVNCALFASIYTKMWFDSFRKGSKKGRRGPLLKRWAIAIQKMRM